MRAWRKGDGSTSICTQPRYALIDYHWYRHDPSRRLIDELHLIIHGLGLSQLERDALVGEFRSRMLALAQGRLTPVKHVKGPMGSVTNLEIFEVRFGIDRGDGRLEMRIYHVEPRKLARPGGSTVIGVHLHHKRTSGVAVNRAQNRELQAAAARFHTGRASNWGR